MLRIAALASSVMASMPIVLPTSNPSAAIRSNPGEHPLVRLHIEVPDQKQPEISPWRQTRPPDPTGVEPATHALGKLIEPVTVENAFQPLTKRRPGADRQVARGNPHHVLPRPLLLSHRHARENTLRPCDHGSRLSTHPTFTRGC